MSEEKKCGKKVYPKTGPYRSFHGYACGKPATDGDFCRIHGPTAEARRKNKSDELWAVKKAKWKAEADAKTHAQNCVKACEGMKDPIAEVAALKEAAWKYQELCK